MAGPRTRLERLMSVIAEVRAGEGTTAALMTVNIFVLMTAYSIVKPVREGLILATRAGARHKSYLTLVFTVVNTNGEYMLGELVARRFKHARTDGEAVKTAITAWFGGFQLRVNVGVMLLQTLVVARVVKALGVRRAFFLFPLIALGDALGGSLAPALAVVSVGKLAENAADYSLNNTLRSMLWLPTTLQMKYQAKQAIDSFVVRLGDVASAGVVFLLAGRLGLGVRAMAFTNLALVGLWLWLARAIFVEQRRLSRGLATVQPVAVPAGAQ